LAKYYTNLLGSKDQGSVNAYMQMSNQDPNNGGQAKKRRKFKKKRAVSHAAGTKLRTMES